MADTPKDTVPNKLQGDVKKLAGSLRRLATLSDQAGGVSEHLAAQLAEVCEMSRKLLDQAGGTPATTSFPQGATDNLKQVQELTASLSSLGAQLMNANKGSMAELIKALVAVDAALNQLRSLSQKLPKVTAPIPIKEKSDEGKTKKPAKAESKAKLAKSEENQLHTEVLALNHLVQGLVLAEKSRSSKPAAFAALVTQAARKLERIQELTEQPAKKSSTISEFFAAIGTGFVDAQKRLDLESEAYARSALQQQTQGKGKPPIATVFRIPKVTAELKCSLEQSSEKKLNLILYSDRKDVRELHQQTVHLELVSVPAPPEYLSAIAAQTLPKKS